MLETSNHIWFVYIGQCKDGSYYTGISQNVAERIARHNAKKGSHHVRTHGSIKLLWTEQHKDLSSARKREIQIKGWTRRKKWALVSGNLSLLKKIIKGRKR